MLDEIRAGKELEGRVRMIFEQSNLSFKEQPSLTPFNLRFDFLVSNQSNQLFVVEVSKRNSNEDIQRLCFRSVICKEFNGNRIKTVLIVPSFNGSWSSLKFIGLLVKFFDSFLFEEDLELLPDMLNSGNKELLFSIVKNKLRLVQPDFGKILDLFQNRKFMELKEMSSLTGLRLSRIKDLVKFNPLNLQTLGLVECFGNTCSLNEKFLE